MKKTKSKKIYKPCLKCNGTGKIKIKPPILLTEDTKKMLDIMKRNNLNQLMVAKTLNLSSGAVSGWFKRETNLQGKIKKIYFKVLEIAGYS